MDSINKGIVTNNSLDADDNPTGGFVQLLVQKDGDSFNAMTINWQDGPRGQEDGTLSDPNGAFVEDVLYAAKQRLEFFQDSKYVDEDNATAIDCINNALIALQNRTNMRTTRNVEGKHEV